MGCCSSLPKDDHPNDDLVDSGPNASDCVNFDHTFRIMLFGDNDVDTQLIFSKFFETERNNCGVRAKEEQTDGPCTDGSNNSNNSSYGEYKEKFSDIGTEVDSEHTHSNEDMSSSLVFEKFSDDWEETYPKKRLLTIKKKHDILKVKLFLKVARRITFETERGISFRNPYRGMNAILLIYDVIRQSSVQFLADQIREVLSYKNSNAIVILVGNKNDLTNSDTADGFAAIDAAKKLSKEFNVTHLQVSALNAKSVKQLFNEVVDLLIKHSKNS